MHYEMKIAGLTRQLPLCPINDELYIAAFVMFGDVAITEASAKELLAKAPEFD
ncbi:MAG: adenine phosphoribosyltransferase, partial [[Eubacterium] sulci]|nr:adenine phosphoribosyltransferase [[Eubacterium] sulci]